MQTKQVIVWRNDLKVRKGKIASQCCHASMAFLTRGLYKTNLSDYPFLANGFYNEKQLEEIENWLNNSFRKIVCYVNSEAELLEIYQKALDKSLIAHIVEDNGATEFKGVKTITALAIGPHSEDKFQGITDHLPLL